MSAAAYEAILMSDEWAKNSVCRFPDMNVSYCCRLRLVVITILNISSSHIEETCIMCDHLYGPVIGSLGNELVACSIFFPDWANPGDDGRVAGWHC